ncbi:hypothetical protein T12_9629 [Trichinella patagoniensis]|uniref:Uncharacterized protein n=1 Tax=Trichinella patagoniensis TaxID=990121 RepID=A0A0V0ZCA1_9BILA|nr:hypothetical protein T12_9629 [Trichinella patagoniensis]
MPFDETAKETTPTCECAWTVIAVGADFVDVLCAAQRLSVDAARGSVVSIPTSKRGRHAGSLGLMCVCKPADEAEIPLQ